MRALMERVVILRRAPSRKLSSSPALIRPQSFVGPMSSITHAVLGETTSGSTEFNHRFLHRWNERWRTVYGAKETCLTLVVSLIFLVVYFSTV